MTFNAISEDKVKQSYDRINPFIKHTPLLSSSLLDSYLGHQIIFKAEGLQKTGAFKLRGALNTLLTLKENSQLPKEVVTFSSGNHAQGVALAAKMLGSNATVFMPSFTSKIKQQAVRGYGAKLHIVNSRHEAEESAYELEKEGAYIIHPFDNDSIIAGQGTACYEALCDQNDFDAIFIPCGGGGLLSGSFLAKKFLKNDALMFGAEPAIANDASISYKTGQIFKFNDSPKTIADGVRSLSVSVRTFHYLKQVDGFIEVEENEIIYWVQWLMHLLKISVEPTAAVAMAAAVKWMRQQETCKRILIILSGGNISPETYQEIWKNNYLEELPSKRIANV